jgi:stage II sporulation protein D
LYQKRQNRNQDYDVRSDVKSQIYAGCTAEKWSTNRAVRLTRHEVLTYKGEILPSYYHATCAGHTEDAANLWDVGLGLEPLKGVACPFCKASPHYRWSKELSLKDLKAALENAGYHIEAITSIGVAARNKSGRVDKLEIKDAGGVTTLLTAKDFRAAVGPNEIRSANFDVKVSGDYAIFWGFGWGHGVGMCQWGAYGMACKGYKAEGILRYYYPGAEISTIEQVAERL